MNEGDIMTDRMKEIEERLEKASPGPWDADYAPGTIAIAERISEDECQPVMIMQGGEEDCKLAACLRNNIEPLLAELKKAREENERLGKRDGNAHIEIIHPVPEDPNPFHRITLKKIYFGVADNSYVVECPEIEAEIERLNVCRDHWKMSYETLRNKP